MHAPNLIQVIPIKPSRHITASYTPSLDPNSEATHQNRLNQEAGHSTIWSC